MKFATKPIRYYPPHLRHVATLHWKIKNSNFWPPANCVCVLQHFNRLLTPRFSQLFSGNSYVNLYAVYPFKYKLFIKILSSLLNTTLIVDKHCSDVCCDEFNQKNRHKKVYLQSVWGKTCFFTTENIDICGRIIKLEAIKMQILCISFHIG